MPTLAANLRRLWWVPLLVMLAGDLWFIVLFRAGLPDLLRLRQLLIYGPLALHLIPRLLLFAAVWPRLKDGGPFQTLLAVQGALPLGFLAASRLLVPILVGRGLIQGWPLQAALHFLPPALELILLSLAFRTRPRAGEEGELSVTASAGLALLGGGPLAMGLMPLLARLQGDPLLEEVAGRDARRASRAAFMTAAFLPLGLFFQVFRGGGLRWMAGLGLLQVPTLLLGAVIWLREARRLGPEGRVWRVLTILALTLLPLALLAAGGILYVLSGLR